MHWRQLARTGQAFVRQQQLQRSSSWHGLLDLRGALLFGTRGRTRAAQAARALLLDAAWQVKLTPQASLGFTLWDDGKTISRDCGRGATGLRCLASWLQRQSLPPPKAQSGRDIELAQHALSSYLQALQRNSPADRILLCSALLDTPDLATSLRRVLWRLSRDADVLVLAPRDAAELQLPELPLTPIVELRGGGSGEVGTAAAEGLAERARQTAAATSRRLRACGARLVQFDSREALPPILGLLRPESTR